MERALRMMIRRMIVETLDKREGKDQNKDGKSDFEDVKIARMRASGMSDKDIKKKYPDMFDESDEGHYEGDSLDEIDMEEYGYKNLSQAGAEKRYASLKKKYPTWKERLKAMSWASDPNKALGSLRSKAMGYKSRS